MFAFLWWVFFPLVQETVAHFLNCWNECSPREHPQWQQGFKYHDVSRERCLLSWSQTESQNHRLRFSISQTESNHVACLLSCTWLFLTPRTVAHQAPLSTRFPRQEYWRRLPFPSPGNLPNPGMPYLLPLLHWQVGSLPAEPQGSELTH